MDKIAKQAERTEKEMLRYQWLAAGGDMSSMAAAFREWLRDNFNIRSKRTLDKQIDLSIADDAARNVKPYKLGDDQ